MRLLSPSPLHSLRRRVRFLIRGIRRVICASFVGNFGSDLMSCQRQCVTHYIFLGVRVQFANTVPACSFFCLETVVVFDQFNVSSRVANTICSRRPALGPACVASGERTRVRSVGSAGYHEAAPCGAGRVERVLRLRSLFRASHNGAVGAYRGAPLGGGGSLPECALRVSVVLPRAGHLVWPSIWGGRGEV